MNIRKTKKLTTIGMLCAFSCPAAFLYHKKRKLSRAMLGLCCGWGCQIVVMMVWNYLIAPIYMGYPKEVIVELLFSAFLPFNVVKGGLNAAITMLLYKPVVTALRRSNLIEAGQQSDKMQLHIGVLLAALFILITCVLLIFSLQKIL